MQRSISTLTENLSGMAYRCLNDKNRTIEVVSKGAKSLTGYAADDFIQNKVVSYNNIIYDEDRQKVRDITNKAIELNIGYQISYRIITAGNEIKWVWEQGCAVFNSDGKVVALEGYISDITEKKMMEEGCLSVRYLYGKVSRGSKVVLEAYDETGKKFIKGASGLLSQIFQHETDHLNGVLFIDKAKNIEEIIPAKANSTQIHE